MSLTDKDIEKIAKLARVGITPAEKEKFKTQINNIFTMFEQLNEVDVKDVPEMAGVGGYTMRTRDADEVKDGNIRDEIMVNAPKSQFGCFVVPKVVDAG